MLFEFVAVAGAALDSGEGGVVGEVFAFEVGMAIGAGERAVDGGLESFGIDEAGDRFAGLGSGKRLVAVAGEAVVVGDIGGGRGGGGGQEEEQSGAG
jgi:hypothetical protein